MAVGADQEGQWHPGAREACKISSPGTMRMGTGNQEGGQQ